MPVMALSTLLKLSFIFPTVLGHGHFHCHVTDTELSWSMFFILWIRGHQFRDYSLVPHRVCIYQPSSNALLFLNNYFLTGNTLYIELNTHCKKFLCFFFFYDKIIGMV